MTSKPTNPKDAVGVAKAPLSTVSAPVMQEIGVALFEGARKYGRHNWRVAGVRSSIYYDATMRHLTAWWEGEDIDPDSGLPHIVKAMAGLMVLRDAQIFGMATDDRPPQAPRDWQGDLNRVALETIQKHPVAADPITNLDADSDVEEHPLARKGD